MAQVRGSAATAVMIMVTMSMLFQCSQATTVQFPWGFSKAAQTKAVSVGNKLQFVYPSTAHNVVEVTLNEYNSCNAGNKLPLAGTNPSVPFTKKGTRYFICSVTGHCAAPNNMKVAVTAS